MNAVVHSSRDHYRDRFSVERCAADWVLPEPITLVGLMKYWLSGKRYRQTGATVMVGMPDEEPLGGGEND